MPTPAMITLLSMIESVEFNSCWSLYYIPEMARSLGLGNKAFVTALLGRARA